jgi:hypothetical protein
MPFNEAEEIRRKHDIIAEGKNISAPIKTFKVRINSNAI